ncbi:MAG: DUF2813 domain-containing protein, partial [Candidatus Electrothrix sp. AX5]|nr:DUF2813 domain-containing protein [Candidatus Electrothrix sp. AX5]
MKIKKIIIENFRGYKNKTIINIEDFTVFIGKNDAGKSTILEALDIFFGNSNPDPGDACVSGDATKVRIGCVFTNFPSELIIDSSNPTSLEKEYLLNIDGDLEIHKIYNCTVPKPKCNSAVAIANHPLEPSCLNLLEQSITKLKAIAKKFEIDLSNPKPNTPTKT